MVPVPSTAGRLRGSAGLRPGGTPYIYLVKNGKAKGVVAGALLGELGVACFQRLDHAEMLR